MGGEIIRVYRSTDRSGTNRTKVWDSSTSPASDDADATTGAFREDVTTGTWSPGTYYITVTSQATGRSESEHAVPVGANTGEVVIGGGSPVTSSMISFGALRTGSQNGTLEYGATSGQRKLIYDGSRFWFFYYAFNSGAISYSYSSDLATWSTPTSTAELSAQPDANTVSVLFDGSSTVLVSYYVTSTPYQKYIRGVISGTTITWGVTTTDVNGGQFSGSGDWIANWAIDSNNKVLFLGTITGGTDVMQSTSTISSTFADTSTAWTKLTEVPTLYYAKKGLIFPLASGNFFILTAGSPGPAVAASKYTGSWANSTVQSISAGYEYDWDAVAVSTSSHFVIAKSGANTFTFQQSTDGGSSWTTSGIGQPGWPTDGLKANYLGAIALASDGTNVYAVAIRGDANNTVAYNKYTVANATWGGWVSMETSSANRLNVNAYVLNGKLIATWTQETGTEVYGAYNSAVATP